MQRSQQKMFCGCCSLRTGTLTCGICCTLYFSVSLILFGISYAGHSAIYTNELDLKSLLEAVWGGFVSSLCIHGAIKENRYFLLPWLIVFAAITTMYTLIGFYFILSGFLQTSLIGGAILLLCVLLIYWWICIANYYIELRDRQCNSLNPNRSYINPRAVTNPAAFANQSPPPYIVAIGTMNGSAQDEKPPAYEQAVTMKNEKAELEQLPRMV